MDYKQIGLKAGLEIHQQLDTNKLFCECPSKVRNEIPTIIVKRELRPLAGETGKIDPAAIFEKKKRKYYLYEVYPDTNCLVEMDEEPPHPVSTEALDIALLITKMLHCEIPDTIQFMRKTVVDGSNVSGFQRSALIGMNGFIETSFGKVGIQTIGLEEDAARRTAENPDSVTFRLDRLGIPLVEIATAPDCKTPEQVKETAEKIGLLLRSTGKVIRGIGTIRQDINISVTGHPRVELKGVQELPQMLKVVENEIERQLSAVKSNEKTESHVRNILPDLKSKFLRPMPGASRMYPETDIPLIKIDKKKIADMEIPESFEEKRKKLEKSGLANDLVEQLLSSDKLEDFEFFIESYPKLNPNLIATTIVITPKDIKRKLQLPELDLDRQVLDRIFLGLYIGLGFCGKDAHWPAIVKESVPAIIEEIAKTKPKGDDLLNIFKKYALLSDVELKNEIAKLKEEFKNMPADKLQGVIIGKLRGKADAQRIIELMKK